MEAEGEMNGATLQAYKEKMLLRIEVWPLKCVKVILSPGKHASESRMEANGKI